MKLLVVAALLVLAVAELKPVLSYSLRDPRFKAGYLYKYNLELNVTAGVLGLSSQVSAAVLEAKVYIYAKTDNEHILKLQEIRVSGSVEAIDHKNGRIELKEDKQFNDRLTSTIKFVLENGKITSYTLSKKDDLRTTKIKKSILRSLEMHIPDSAIDAVEAPKNAGRPVSYNETEDTVYGVHISSYSISVIPFAEFPATTAVYNISRIDNFEAEWYPTHKTHYNFQKQGCSEVCRKAGEWKSNAFAAGCPIGFEPHESPIKKSFNHEQTLSHFERTETLSLDTVTTAEVHFAKMYDQDMEVLFRYRLSNFEISSEETLDLESNQIISVPDLHDWDSEIDEKEIDDLCNYQRADESVQASKDLLTEISSLIVNHPVDAPVGEKAMLLRDALSYLTVDGFTQVADTITNLNNLAFRSHEEKVKRQIWMDALPVVGTRESVKFIVKYIQTQFLKPNPNMLVWEVKEILEALPQNIANPGKDTIDELMKLIENTDFVSKSHLLHSAAHISLARVISEACGIPPPTQSSSISYHMKSRGCPENVEDIIKTISNKLKSTDIPGEIIVYIRTLTQTGTKEAVSALSDYVYGTAKNVQSLTERFIDYIKYTATYALINVAAKYPEDVLEVVLPVFFNDSESHKIRNAAFEVIIQCQPPLDVLEKVAIHSWNEINHEVGSFVTSTLETFGNSSHPCRQLVAHRIKTVLPQVKRFDVGIHHAKNYLWSYFDGLRDFGLEGRMVYNPNNESFIPSNVFASLSYSMESLKDVIFQNALSIEGLTHKKVWEQLIEYLNIEGVEPIEKEEKIFGEGKKGIYYLHPRDVDDLRMTIYHRLFYKSSFYFLDTDGRKQAWEHMSKFFEAYLKKRDTEYTGYIVKMFIPSYYHTISIAKTLPYPVEFQMRQPVIFAVSIQTPDNEILPPSRKSFDLHFKPSLYLNKLFTLQMKNIGDCKEVGVYHEHNIAMTYPFDLKYNAQRFPNITFKYRVPADPKKIVYYVSESGTYAGQKELQKLPTTGSKKPIRTRISPFKFEKQLNFVAIPSVYIAVHTEDTNFFAQDLPRTPGEAIHVALKRFLNAGWRSKSVNISIAKDQVGWTSDSEGTFSFQYSRKHITGSSSTVIEPDWFKYLTTCEVNSVDNFARTARKISDVLNVDLPHMSHLLNIKIEAEPLTNIAKFKMEFNHTYAKDLFTVHAEGTSKKWSNNERYEFSLDHLMGYWQMPNEFHYDKHYGEQYAGFYTSVNLPSTDKPECPCIAWKRVELAFCGNLHFESNWNILEKELAERVEDKHFFPETHKKCLNDIEAGDPLSEDCLKAIRERSLFNKLNLQMIWNKDYIHENSTHFARIADVYLKHYFFKYMELSSQKNEPNKVNIKMDYIDKFVDEPVVDVEIKKPSETLKLRRVPSKPLQPLSSIYSVLETFLLEVTNNTYPPTCVLSKNYVQTFDKVTYEFTPENCQYVLSTHCTRSKNFAVVIKGREEIHIHVASSLVVLFPESVRPPYTVRFNENNYELFKPHLFHERHDFYAYREKVHGNTHIHVIATETGIHLVYDGKNVKLQVSPRYKGELCGLCSEFDGVKLREFKSIDRCLYNDPIGFAQSTMIQRDNAKCKIRNGYGEKFCPYDPVKTWGPLNRNRRSVFGVAHETTQLKNLALPIGNKICFSIEPVPFCENDAEPLEAEMQNIEFHCMSSSNATAIKMMSEVEERHLDELEEMSVDYEETRSIPIIC